MSRAKKACSASRFARRAALAAMLFAGFTGGIQAADGTWNADAGDNWNVATRWTGSNIADGAGFTANFIFNITAARTVTVNTARTIGNLVFTDSTTSSSDLTIANSGGSILTLDVLAGASTINVTQAGRTLTISSLLAGNDGILKSGAGNLTLSGANTGLSGTFSVAAGNVTPTVGTALGSMTVLFDAASTGGVSFTGGQTYSNAIVVNSGVAGTVGLGLIRHSGTGGVATLTGNISLIGTPPAGGVFGGSNIVGQELRVNGQINSSTAGFSQRIGRVIYAGGGDTTGPFTVTDTALIGALNGLPVGVSPKLGGSGAATLDLNGFNQTIVGLEFGGSNGTLELRTGTLTIGGNITAVGATSVHTMNAGTGGTLTIGSTPRNLDIASNPVIYTNSPAGLTINNSTFTGTATLTRLGVGSLALNNATFIAPVALNAGSTRGTAAFNGGLTVNTGATINPGSTANAGAISAATLAFAGASTAIFPITIAGTNSSINVTAANGLTNTAPAAGVTLQVNQIGGLMPNGTYKLINYTGTSPGLTGFTLPQVGHVTGTLTDTGSAIAYVVTGNDKVKWTGAVDSVWNVNATSNWKTSTGNVATNYFNGDAIIFDDTGINTTISVGTTPLAPTTIEFNNTNAVPYTFSGTGAAGIVGTAPITQTGNGVNLIDMPANNSTGAVTVSAGTLDIRQNTVSTMFAFPGGDVALSSAATLRLGSNNASFNFIRNLTGNGTLVLDTSLGGTHSVTAPVTVNFTGDNTNFSGLLKLSPSTPANGSFRTDATTSTADLGTATIDVDSGAQLWVAAATFNNNITITGVGPQEAAGGANAVISTGLVAYAPAYANYAFATNSGIGAIRLPANAILAGTVTLDGSAKIGPYSATATISGSLKTTNATDVLVVGGGGAANTLVLTGTNNAGANPLQRVWINSGGTVFNQTLQIGNNSTSGTLGTGDVVLFGQNAGGSAILDVRRSDGYTMDANQKIYATINDAASITNPHDAASRPYQANIAINTTGTGFTVGSGNIIDLADNTTNTDGAGFLRVGTAVSGSLLNIQAGAIVDVGYFGLSEAANVNATVNQTGGAVTVRNQLRVGHFGTETSVYNISGASTLNLNGISPSLSPSTAGAGGNAATGDNNINALATALLEGGGIYVGIDGRGIFNQSGTSTVSTNWIVLDNRATTDTGANMSGGGIDQYNLSGGTLNVKSTWGVIQRATNTAEVNVSGGTIRVDNSGIGGTTGQGNTVAINVPLDTVLNVSSTGAILDTNAATLTGNGFTLTRNVQGSGILTTQGGGTVTLNPNVLGGVGTQSITANIAGTSPIVKDGAGVTTFLSAQSYTGPTSVNVGLLNLHGSMATGSLTVANGAAVSGEPTIAAVTLGNSTLYMNPTTTGALTGTTLTVNGPLTVDFSAAPVGAGPFTVLKYTTNTTPAASYQLANAAGYRGTPTIADDTAGNIVLSGLSTKALTWAGTTATWDANATPNWIDSTNLAGPVENFFSYDNVTFDDSVPAVATTITATGIVQPAAITVNSVTNNYTIGGVIGGAGSVTKAGTSALTLTGANTYIGPVAINGGKIVVTAANNLGSGLPGNNVNLNGGSLEVLTNNINLGSARTLNVGASGGTLITANGRTQTISGSIAGAGALTFSGGGTFDVRGDNSGFTGPISVNSIGAAAGATTLFLTSALPNTTVTLEPSTIANAATTLQFNGLPLQAGLNLVMKTNNPITPTSVSFRSQLLSNAPGAAVNGTIQLEGNDLAVFNAGTGGLTSALDINGVVGQTVNGFTGILFVRGTGIGNLNSVITLPTGNVSKTDAGTWNLNTTGNNWLNTVVAVGTLRLGIADALPVTTAVTMGQNDTSAAVFDLNGFNQTIGRLTSNPVNGTNATSKSITSPTSAVLTVNQATNTEYGGALTGLLNFVKSGAGTLTLSGAGTNTGTTLVSGGTLTIRGTARGTSSITVDPSATLELNATNIFVANHDTAVDNGRVITVNAGTLLMNTAAIARIGNITLNNGSTWTSNSGLAGFDVLLGNTTTGAATITVSGAGAAVMNGTGGIHLQGVQNFNVGDVTSSSAVDLSVDLILDNPGSTGGAAGGINKLGLGTMILSNNNTYTGGTTISAGVLQVGVGAGTGTVGTGAVTNNGSLIVNRTGVLTTGAITGTGTTTIQAGELASKSIRQSVLDVGAGSQVTIASSGGNKPAGISVFTSTTGNALTLASTGVLDVKDNDLIAYYPSGTGAAALATLRQRILDGFLGTAGVPRITSSTALLDGDKFLVALDNGPFGIPAWEGVTLTGSNQIIAKYTLFGDLNLDGAVDAADYGVIDNNFGTGVDWLTGDANLDGTVDAADYGAIDNNFGKSFPALGFGSIDAGGSFASGSAAFAAAGLTATAVPEPSSCVLGGLGLLGLLGAGLRRRRTRAAR